MGCREEQREIYIIIDIWREREREREIFTWQPQPRFSKERRERPQRKKRRLGFSVYSHLEGHKMLNISKKIIK